MTAAGISKELGQIGLSRAQRIPFFLFNLRSGKTTDMEGAVLLARIIWLYQPNRDGRPVQFDGKGLLRTSHARLAGPIKLTPSQMKRAIARLKAGGYIKTHRQSILNRHGKRNHIWEIWPVPTAIKRLSEEPENSGANPDSEGDVSADSNVRICTEDGSGYGPYSDISSSDIQTNYTPKGDDSFCESELEDLKRKLRLYCPYRNAKELQDTTERILSEHGFTVRRDFLVADRGDGTPGKIDLLAQRATVRLAIECDKYVTREKSKIKLRQVDAVRLVLLRLGWEEEPPMGGIDYVIALGSDPYSKELPVPKSWDDPDLRIIYRFLMSRKIKPGLSWLGFADKSRKAQSSCFHHPDGEATISIWGVHPLEFCAAVELSFRKHNYATIALVGRLLAYNRSDCIRLAQASDPRFKDERSAWRVRNGFHQIGGVS